MDTTKSQGAMLKLQKVSMYLAQAVRLGAVAGTVRTLLVAFHQRDAQRSTARSEAPTEAEDALAAPEVQGSCREHSGADNAQESATHLRNLLYRA